MNFSVQHCFVRVTFMLAPARRHSSKTNSHKRMYVITSRRAGGSSSTEHSARVRQLAHLFLCFHMPTARTQVNAGSPSFATPGTNKQSSNANYTSRNVLSATHGIFGCSRVCPDLYPPFTGALCRSPINSC